MKESPVAEPSMNSQALLLDAKTMLRLALREVDTAIERVRLVNDIEDRRVA